MHRTPVAELLRVASLALLTFVVFGASWALASANASGAIAVRPIDVARVASVSRSLPRDVPPPAPALLRVSAGDVMHLVRVAEHDTIVREPLAFPIELLYDPDLLVGRVVVVSAGIAGLADNTYRVQVLDGAETGRTLASSLEIVAPVAEVRRVGTKPAPAPADIESVIRSAAAVWGADANQLLRVAWCESRYNPLAYNARSGASGLFQFMPATWAANSARAGYGGASVFDPVASANTAAFMFHSGQAWQWACK